MRGGKEQMMVEFLQEALADGKQAVLIVSSPVERKRLIDSYGLPPGSVILSDDERAVAAEMSPLPGHLAYLERWGNG